MKKKRIRILLVLITSATAIIIFSFTLGRELYEGRNQTLFSFGLVHFSGYLFFLLMPVELAFVYYLSFFREWQVIVIALTTAELAQIIDYFIGHSISQKIINNLIGEKRIQESEKHILKYGNLTILLFNFLPLSSPLIAVAAGMLKYRFKDFLFFSTVGLIVKYLILTILFESIIL